MSTDSVKKTARLKLNELFATALCGNDILSSCLYVSGIAILFSGIYAPLVLCGIVLVLFFYKSVYMEVVEALPMNGGAYNCLLNSTSKTIAAIAGITTFLSYIATAVISAEVSMHYLHTLFAFPVLPMTIGLLFVFALLVIFGITNSAKVAVGIFFFHLFSLSVLLTIGVFAFLTGHSFLADNIAHTGEILHRHGGLANALFFAFAACLLGISGFESSSDFVEQQQKGVFRKTLRNMLIGIAVFNPLLALLVLNSVPYETIVSSKEFLLSSVGLAIGGKILQYIIVIDAFFVLAGAVLTSYIGVSGLIHRMASDACLPGLLTKQNKKGAFPRIVMLFFFLCTSILLVTQGNLLSLAGVYALAFLGVMTLFAFGNLVLRQTRRELKRPYKAPLVFVVFAFVATLMGIWGNIRLDPGNVRVFLFYFLPVLTVTLLVVYEDYVLRFLLKVTRPVGFVHAFFERYFADITNGTFVVFVHHINKLHRILEYINRNETGWNIILVHCKGEEDKDYEKSFHEFEKALPVIQKCGVFPHFSLQVVYKDEVFSPRLIQKVSKEFNVRPNRMLIGSIHDSHPYDYEDLSGVRIIL